MNKENTTYIDLFSCLHIQYFCTAAVLLTNYTKKITFSIIIQLQTYLLHTEIQQPCVFSIDSLKITSAH